MKVKVIRDNRHYLLFTVVAYGFGVLGSFGRKTNQHILVLGFL